MSETVHPAVGEAAQILIAAKGHEFSKSVVALLQALLPATKERDGAKCWFICDSLWQYDEFKDWARQNGIPARSPKDPMRTAEVLKT